MTNADEIRTANPAELTDDELRARGLEIYLGMSVPRLQTVADRLGVSKDVVVKWHSQDSWMDKRGRQRAADNERLKASKLEICDAATAAIKLLKGRISDAQQTRHMTVQDLGALVRALQQALEIVEKTAS